MQKKVVEMTDWIKVARVVELSYECFCVFKYRVLSERDPALNITKELSGNDKRWVQSSPRFFLKSWHSFKKNLLPTW